jgi:nitrous oxidase accessory protein NosD
MKRVIRSAGQAMLLCLLAILLMCAPATAATILVDGTDAALDTDGCGGGPDTAADPCNTIQAGVDVAAAFDTVAVSPTVPYDGPVVVTQDNVTIRGAMAGIPGQDRARTGTGETVLRTPGGSAAGFTLSGADDTVTGFRIEGSPASPGETAPAIAVRRNAGHVFDNIIEHNAPGVLIDGSAAEVRDNAFYDNDAGSAAWGVWSITSAVGLHVRGNRFEGAGQGGVNVQGVVTRVSDAEIAENTILGGPVGIEFGAAIRLLIRGNTITGQSNVGIRADSVPMRPPSTVAFIYGNNLSGIGDPSDPQTAAIYVGLNALQPDGSFQRNRIAGNARSIVDHGASIHAPDNWWGCNEGFAICGSSRLLDGGTIIAEPHLVLSASPPVQASIGTPVPVSADIRLNSDGDTVPLEAPVPPPLPFGFEKLGGPGSLESFSAPAGGGATAVVKSEAPGTTQVRATLDAATADTSVEFVGPTTVKAPVKDAKAPILRRVSLRPRTFAVDRPRRARAARHRRGATLRFRLSENATMRFSVSRASKQKKRKARAVGSLRLSGRAGANSTHFRGRVGKKWLRPGRYRGTLVATDSAGNRSVAKRLSFRIASI